MSDMSDEDTLDVIPAFQGDPVYDWIWAQVASWVQDALHEAARESGLTFEERRRHATWNWGEKGSPQHREVRYIRLNGSGREMIGAFCGGKRAAWFEGRDLHQLRGLAAEIRACLGFPPPPRDHVIRLHPGL